MRSHKQLYAWQRADATALAIHRFCDSRWSPPRAVVFEQLRRSSLSVPLNIAEGNANGPGARCRYHVRVAYASAVETTELLGFLQRLDLECGALIASSQEVQAVTLRLLRSLK